MRSELDLNRFMTANSLMLRRDTSMNTFDFANHIGLHNVMSDEDAAKFGSRDIVQEIENGELFPKDEFLDKYATGSGLKKKDLVVYFKGAKKQ